jgi:hypothetical protein
VVSRAIAVPPALDRDGIEWYRAGVERLLVHLSDDAEAWAASGARRAGERFVRKEPSRVAAKAAALPGPPGVSLEDEMRRVGLAVSAAEAA